MRPDAAEHLLGEGWVKGRVCVGEPGRDEVHEGLRARDAPDLVGVCVVEELPHQDVHCLRGEERGLTAIVSGEQGYGHHDALLQAWSPHDAQWVPRGSP